MASKDPEPPILLVVDLQHGLVEGPAEWGPRSTPHLVENVKYLLKTWRERSWPILRVQHDELDEPDNPIASKFPETYKLHPCAVPEGDEKVFIKHTGSAFVGTELPALINGYGHRKIVLIGMDGAQCINSTARSGADLKFEVIVVADACASYGMEHWKTGDTVDAEETHGAAMGMLRAYGKVTTTKDVLGLLGY